MDIVYLRDKMTRFGFKVKRCKKPIEYELECLKKLYIDNESCAIYTRKLSAVGTWIWNINKDKWYEIIYTPFKEG